MTAQEISPEAPVELAGYMAAGALAWLSEGDAFQPRYMIHKDGARDMVELPSSLSMPTSTGLRVKKAQERLASNPDGAQYAVLAYDGRLTLPEVPGGQIDAVFVEAHDFTRPGQGTITVAVPYTPTADGKAFAVHRPKALRPPEAVQPFLFTAFFRGVARHVEGAKIWSRHRDDSL